MPLPSECPGQPRRAWRADLRLLCLWRVLFAVVAVVVVPVVVVGVVVLPVVPVVPVVSVVLVVLPGCPGSPGLVQAQATPPPLASVRTETATASVCRCILMFEDLL